MRWQAKGPQVRVRICGNPHIPDQQCWVDAWLAQMWLDMRAPGIEVLSSCLSEQEVRLRVDASRRVV